MTTYRIRVEMPTPPADTREVAHLVGALGGDVVSVDLREVDGAREVDEMVVDFGEDSDGGTLHQALARDPSATLLSTQRCEPDEPISDALHWARTATDAQHDRPAQGLPHRLSAACPLAHVSVRPANEVASLPVVQMAMARRGPVVQRCGGLPDDVPAAGARGASAWLLAVADSYPQPQTVALLSRPMSLRFSAYEVARVEVLMGRGTR